MRTMSLCSCVLLMLSAFIGSARAEEKPVRDLGSRLELFVDDWLIDQMKDVSLVLHHPTPREVAIRFNTPWEGIDTAYITIFKDGDRYRMYYRGNPDDRLEFTCYAESKDAITWTKPNLGLFSFKDSKENNIVWSGPGTHNFTPFKDPNPAAKESERYKAVGKGPLLAFGSSDGIHWKVIQEKPIITKGAFDSQNVAFWDAEKKKYVAFFRGFHDGKRDILTCTSEDFLNWTEPRFVDYGGVPLEHFYTNAITPYFRAPHIYVGFPKRFVPERHVVTEQKEKGVSDAVFISSRDGVHFSRRFREAFIRPGLEHLNWMHRSNMTAWGLLQTSPTEISLYYSENYNTPKNQLRRGTLRLDGFASIQAPATGGEWISKPFLFKGKELVLNYSTSAAGSVQVELQSEAGQPLPGFSLAECPEIYGDEIERVVTWKGGKDVSQWEGKTIRLRSVMKDADLYSLRFRP